MIHMQVMLGDNSLVVVGLEQWNEDKVFHRESLGDSVEFNFNSHSCRAARLGG